MLGNRNSHRCASTLILMLAISDIRHRHLLFRYWKKICQTENSQSDIGRVPLSTSESIPISKKYFSHPYFSHPLDLDPRPLFLQASFFPLSHCADLRTHGCQISDKSIFRYQILCRTPLSSGRYRKVRYQAQSDIADHGYWNKCPPIGTAYMTTKA
jgi:hypothetical protein